MPTDEPRRHPVRLLIVAYYFPPSGGAGVQRVLKWVKYLPEFGVEPVVLTVDDGAYPGHDESLLDEVPAGTRVVRTSSINPFAWYARLTGKSTTEVVAAHTDEVGDDGGWSKRGARFIRANCLIPDARVGWVPFARRAARRLIEDGAADVILTSGPPHSTHLVARRLDIPWIADFRDPWTDIHYLALLRRTRAASRLDARLEQRVLKEADAVVTVSPSWSRLLAEKRASSVEVIENGFDPDDFRGEVPTSDGPLTIAHVGSLYASRNPVALWTAISRLEGLYGEGSIRVRVIGRTSPVVRRSAAEQSVSVDWISYLPHQDAVREMRSSHVLLLSTEPHDQEDGHITGKIYEYLASGRPILGLGAPNGDAAALLASTGAGRMFARDDVEGCFDWLHRQMKMHQQGDEPAGVSAADLEPYSRRRQAGELASLVRRITAENAGGR